MTRGKFIVFEGADSVGKSTIAKMIVEWLKEQGIEAIYTKHPGSTDVGGELRKISKHSHSKIPPITEALINAAANNAFIEQVLIPALDRGAWVIGDRCNYISSLVYQVASGVTLTCLDRIHDATHPNPPKIDMLFILRAPKEEVERRRTERNLIGYDRYEESPDYMSNVSAAYEVLANAHRDRLNKFVKTTRGGSGDPTPMAFYIDAGKKKGEVFDLVSESIKGILEVPTSPR